MDKRTAFRPDGLRAADLLQMHNVTHHCVLLERFSLCRFMHEVGGLVLNRDTGGARQLLSVYLPEDEPLHVLPHVHTCCRTTA